MDTTYQGLEGNLRISIHILDGMPAPATPPLVAKYMLLSSNTTCFRT